MKILLVVVLALSLAACQTVPRTIEVKVPVKVGCLGAKPKRPAERFGEGPYPGDKVAAQLAMADSLAFQAYSTGLEVAMAGCDPKPQ